MNRPLTWLIVLGLTVGISACDKKEGVPLPKTDAREVKQQAKEPVGAAEKRSRIRSIDAIGQGAMRILHVIERRSGAI